MNPEPIQFFTEDIGYTIRDKNKLRSSLEKLIKSENFFSGPVSIILCSDRFLKGYNKKYLEQNSYTDVITFDFSEEEGYISGDIYISLEGIRANARIYGVSIRKELERVMIHGVLHLMGMEDQTETDKTAMRRKEDIYLFKYFKD